MALYRRNNMSSFAQLKKNAQTTLGKLAKDMESNTKTNFDDTRFFVLERDKSDIGFAVIRFLPAPPDHDLPYVKVYRHAFKNPDTGLWYIENCPTTIGKSCPACEANSELWNSGIKSKKDLASSRKRQLQYISNIYVVSDPKNPDNEGKVFLFKFGKKIFDKIAKSIDPDFEDETPVNPFDFWTGANFKLKARRFEGQINYDKSEFETPSALLDGDDEKLEQLWKSEYSLNEFVEPGQFKSYEELKMRFNKVIGLNQNQNIKSKQNDFSEDDVPFDEDNEHFDTVRKEKTVSTNTHSSNDDDLAMYAELLKD